MKRIFLYSLIAILLLGSTPYQAEALTTSKRSALLAEITRLTEQLTQLQAELADIQKADKRRLVQTTDIHESRFYDGAFEALYAVEGNELKSLTSADIRVGDKKVWNTLVRLVGEEFVSDYIAEFRVFNDTDSYMGAFIERIDGSSWLLALNRFNENYVTEYDSQFTIEILLHESAHIPFFENPQYKEDFVTQFWSEGKIARHAERLLDADLATQNELGVKYYEANEEDFVSDYAASSPTEDLVESFVQFVVNDNVPRGSKLKDRKVRFFSAYPDLVRWRAELRGSGLI